MESLNIMRHIIQVTHYNLDPNITFPISIAVITILLAKFNRPMGRSVFIYGIYAINLIEQLPTVRKSKSYWFLLTDPWDDTFHDD